MRPRDELIVNCSITILVSCFCILAPLRDHRESSSSKIFARVSYEWVDINGNRNYKTNVRRIQKKKPCDQRFNFSKIMFIYYILSCKK